MLGVEFPILAFGRCSRRGGGGHPGRADSACSGPWPTRPTSSTWTSPGSRSRPGAVVTASTSCLPAKYAGADEGGIDADTVRQLLPPAQQFVEEILRRYGVPELPADMRSGSQRNVLANVASKGYEPLLDVAFAHDITLVASALGAPPPSLLGRAHDAGVVVAALAGNLSTRSATTRRGSTSSWRRAPRRGATPARSPPWCSCPRSSTPSHPPRCWRRVASATDDNRGRAGARGAGRVVRLGVAHDRGGRDPARGETEVPPSGLSATPSGPGH